MAALDFWKRLPVWARLITIVLGANAFLAAVLVLCEYRLAFPGWTFGKAMRNPPPDSVIEQQVLLSSAGDHIDSWWLPSPGWTPHKGAVIYFHGNAENL